MAIKLKDQLSWNEFDKESRKEKIITEVKPFNRLIAHSKNFFIVAGYGSFTQGYVLIITKDFIPSFGLIENKMLEEVNFLIELLKLNLKDKYKKKAVVFEHGMCACVGGLDRAHLHIMSVNENTTEDSLKRSIESALYKRKAGIKSIHFKKYDLTNIHDINQFLEDNEYEEGVDYEVEGKLLKLNDIKDLKVEEWPLVTFNHITKGGHYVYFKSDYTEASFLTKQNFQTQFGRQAVFENEMYLSEDFRKKINTLKKKNLMMEPWKWQDCFFEENIITTVNDTRKTLKDYLSNFEPEYKKYEFKIL
jgi:hypothetical protein